MEVAFFLARTVIAIVLIVSLFTKNSEHVIEPTEAATPLLKVAYKGINAAHTTFSVATVYLLLGPFPALALVLLWSMIFVGAVLKRIVGGASCQCYGALATEGTLRARTLNVVMGICSGTVLLYLWFSEKGIESNAMGPFTPLAILVASGLISASISFRRSSHTGGSVSVHEPIVLGSEIVGRFRSGRGLELKDLAAKDALTLFIGTTSNCSACVALKPPIFSLLSQFLNPIQTVLLHDDFPSDDDELPHVLRVKSDLNFVQRLGGERFPFAVVLRSDTFQPIGKVEYGADIGALLMRLLVVRNGKLHAVR